MEGPQSFAGWLKWAGLKAPKKMSPQAMLELLENADSLPRSVRHSERRFASQDLRELWQLSCAVRGARAATGVSRRAVTVSWSDTPMRDPATGLLRHAVRRGASVVMWCCGNILAP